MTPEPTNGKRPFAERAFYVVLWLLAAVFIVVPVVLWLAGEGTTLSAFMFAPVILLLFIRFRPRPAKRRDDPPRGEKNKPT